MRAEVVLEGLATPEGPTVLGDRRIAFVEQTRGRVSAFEGAGRTTLARLGHSPNSTALGRDGAIFVCMNGGVVGPWRSPRPEPPGVVRLAPDGIATTLSWDFGQGSAPNDLAFGPDGRLYVSDPAQPFDPDDRRSGGRLVALGADSDVMDVGAVYPNGVAFDSAGRLVWTESYTRAVCRVGEDGVPVTLCRLPAGQVPDGLAAAADGRLFVTTCGSHGVTVVGEDGQVEGLIELDDRANPTNCCFEDGALWVTDFGMDWEAREDAGRLWRLETDAIAAPMFGGEGAPDG